MKRIIRVGSRDSKLALVQTNWVINKIKKIHPELEFEITSIKTKGDVLLETRLDKIGGKGLFIKELELALISGEIDIAVHSLKDMPAEIPEGLTIAVYSEREDPRDVLVTSEGKMLKDLPKGAIIGTSSSRREKQLLEIRPDLQCKTLRGNVLTRINKLVNGEYDALMLAAAGLKRLSLENWCVQYFNAEEIIPSVGQGILAIEARNGDDNQYLLDSIHNQESYWAASAERAYMERLNGGCTTPIAAHAMIEGENMKLYGMLALVDEQKVFRAYLEGLKSDAKSLGLELAEQINKQLQGAM
jgi:hydroxymethylbilane synthase